MLAHVLFSLAYALVGLVLEILVVHVGRTPGSALRSWLSATRFESWSGRSAGLDGSP